MSAFNQTPDPRSLLHEELPRDGYLQLLTPPALTYIRELRRVLVKDPHYLLFHSDSVSLRIRSLLPQLRTTGGDADQQTVIAWVKEAIVSLSSFEKM